jgi:chorismate synthase
MAIEIRPIESFDEYTACEQLQARVWSADTAVPLNLLVTVQRNGGLVLGAFDGPALVGFVFGFLARGSDGRLKHASHMAAVLPDYRNAGLGEQLKWAQRERVLAQGLTLMTWTYDPALSRNARLNIRKLGGSVRTYYRNAYGPAPETADGPLPSDRFIVEWQLDDPQVQARLSGRLPALDWLHEPLINPTLSGGLQLPTTARARLRIPLLHDWLTVHEPATARTWRYQIRASAEAAFAAGYAVVDYARDDEAAYYLLEQRGD